MKDDLEQLLKEADDWATNDVWYHEANRLKVQRLVAIVRRQNEHIVQSLKYGTTSQGNTPEAVAAYVTLKDVQAIARGERLRAEYENLRAQLAEAVELLESCLTFVPRATSTEEDTRAFLEKFGGQKQ